MGRMQPRMAVNVAQHKIVSLPETWDLFVITYLNVCNVWSKTTLLPVWPRDTKRLDTPETIMKRYCPHITRSAKKGKASLRVGYSVVLWPPGNQVLSGPLPLWHISFLAWGLLWVRGGSCTTACPAEWKLPAEEAAAEALWIPCEQSGLSRKPPGRLTWVPLAWTQPHAHP